eukprot:5363187-Pyramimonas_sp.AAC.1
MFPRLPILKRCPDRSARSGDCGSRGSRPLRPGSPNLCAAVSCSLATWRNVTRTSGRPPDAQHSQAVSREGGVGDADGHQDTQS